MQLDKLPPLPPPPLLAQRMTIRDPPLLFVDSLMSVSVSNFPLNNSRMDWWKLVRVSFEIMGYGAGHCKVDDVG